MAKYYVKVSANRGLKYAIVDAYNEQDALWEAHSMYEETFGAVRGAAIECIDCNDEALFREKHKGFIIEAGQHSEPTTVVGWIFEKIFR